MSFALSAIIIILFLLPGAIVLTIYYTSFAEKEASIYIPLTDLLLRGLLYSFILHTIGILLLYTLGVSPKFQEIFDILIGKEIPVWKEFHKDYLKFSGYLVVLLLISAAGTIWFKQFVVSRNLDINLFSLRRSSYWFYMFSARYLEMTGRPGEEREVDLILLDVLCKNEVLYSGVLVDFNYSPQKDQLENLILQNVQKRAYIKNESKPNAQELSGHNEQIETDTNKLKIEASTRNIIDIPGDCFLLPADQIININIKYLGIDDTRANMTS